jgi:hypothetical protein
MLSDSGQPCLLLPARRKKGEDIVTSTEEEEINKSGIFSLAHPPIQHFGHTHFYQYKCICIYMFILQINMHVGGDNSSMIIHVADGGGY